MSHPLIDNLLALDEVSLVHAADLDAFLDADVTRATALFITGDPNKRLETADVAVVLRELLRQHPGRLRAGVVALADEGAVMKAVGAFASPALVFMQGRERLETIPKIQDWSVYAEKVPHILARADGALPA